MNAPKTAAETAQAQQMHPKDLLISDLEHFGESLLRNQEMGEKRISFFITLVTAVTGALVVVSKTEHGLESITQLSSVAIFILLMLGLLTYLRVLKRNHQTDEYIATMMYIRRTYAAACDSLKEYPAKVPQKVDSWSNVLPVGGYLETIAIIEATLLFAWLAITSIVQLVPAAVIAALTAMLLMIPEYIRRANRYIRRANRGTHK